MTDFQISNNFCLVFLVLAGKNLGIELRLNATFKKADFVSEHREADS